MFRTICKDNGLKYFGPWHLKIRDEHTTGATPYEQKVGVNWHRGIFLDVFPILYLPYSIIIRKLQFLLLKIIRKTIEYEEWLHWPKEIKKNSFKDKTLSIILKGFEKIFKYRFLCEKFLKICNWRKKPSSHLAHISFDFYSKEKLIYDARWFDETDYLEFENMKVPVPQMYDEYLKYRYGDYSKLIVGTSYHSEMLFDAEKSYKEIL